MSSAPQQPGGRPQGQGPSDSLELYLDRRLRPPEKEAFEEILRASPQQRAQVRVQREINAALGRLFDAASADSTPVSIPLSAPARPNPWRRRFPMLAAAAMVLIAAGVYFAVLRGPGGPAGPVAPSGPDRLGPLYQAQLAGGFKPETVCTTRDEFATWVRDYYGQPLYPDTPAAGIELVGWNYAPAVSSNSGILLAKAEGKEVVVVIDRSIREKAPLAPPADPSLHSFRQEMGSLVLYEVSPLDHAAILPRLSMKP